jgi:DNA-binding NarL/FixJ family response regulator
MSQSESYNILVADGTDFYPEVTRRILEYGNHDYSIVNTYEEAMEELQKNSYDLIMIDTEMETKSGFDLLEYVQKEKPDLPYIMTTEHDVDRYIKPAVERQVGNMLVKPMKRDELLLLIERLITKKGIFGLDNYIPNMIHKEIIKINKTAEINKSIDQTLKKAQEWGFSFPNMNNIRLVLNEMLVNALYHSHGFTEQKLKREKIELEEGKYVELAYACNETKFGVSIIDFNGKLTKSAFLNTLSELVTRDQKIQELVQKGEDFTSLLLDRGRGLDITRKLSGEYQINIFKDKKTEIILIFDVDYYKDDNIGTIKIFELS